MGVVDVIPVSGSLHLIPFLIAGWLLTEALSRLVRKHPRSRCGSGGASGPRVRAGVCLARLEIK